MQARTISKLSLVDEADVDSSYLQPSCCRRELCVDGQGDSACQLVSEDSFDWRSPQEAEYPTGRLPNCAVQPFLFVENIAGEFGDIIAISSPMMLGQSLPGLIGDIACSTVCDSCSAAGAKQIDAEGSSVFLPPAIRSGPARLPRSGGNCSSSLSDYPRCAWLCWSTSRHTFNWRTDATRRSPEVLIAPCVRPSYVPLAKSAVLGLCPAFVDHLVSVGRVLLSGNGFYSVNVASLLIRAKSIALCVPQRSVARDRGER